MVEARARWEGDCRGGLVTGSTGHMNPQFLLTVSHLTGLFLTLTQEQGSEYEHVMCIMLAAGTPAARICPVTAREIAADTTVHTGAPRNQREVCAPLCCVHVSPRIIKFLQVSVEVSAVQPGKYVIIPCTFYPDRERGFVLRVYTPPLSAVGGRAKPLVALETLGHAPVGLGAGGFSHVALDIPACTGDPLARASGISVNAPLLSTQS